MKDYREMFINKIARIAKEKGMNDRIYTRAELASLNLQELKSLSNELEEK